MKKQGQKGTTKITNGNYEDYKWKDADTNVKEAGEGGAGKRARRPSVLLRRGGGGRRMWRGRAAGPSTVAWGGRNGAEHWERGGRSVASGGRSETEGRAVGSRRGVRADKGEAPPARSAGSRGSVPKWSGGRPCGAKPTRDRARCPAPAPTPRARCSAPAPPREAPRRPAALTEGRRAQRAAPHDPAANRQ